MSESVLPPIPELLQTALVLIQKGAATKDKEILAQAETVIEAILVQDPKQPDALMQKALLLGLLERYPEAIATFEALLTLLPNNTRVLVQYANLLQASGNAAKAMEVLQKCALLEPGNQEITASLARLYVREGQQDKAINLYKKNLDKHPYDMELRFQLASTYVSLDRLDEAAAEVQFILQALPHTPEALDVLVDIRRQQNRFDEALELSQSLLSMVPNNGIYMARHGNIMRSLGRIDEAEAYLVALRNSPQTTAMADASYAELLNDRKLFKESLAVCNEALEKYTDNADLYAQKGSALFSLEEFDEAHEAFEKAFELAPNNGRIADNLGLSLIKSDKYKEAEPYIKRAVELFPQSFTANNNLAIIYQNTDREDEAEVAYKRTIEVAPNPAQAAMAMANLANLLRLKGRLPEALALVDEALEKDDSNPNVFNQGGLIAQALNDHDAALKYFERGIEIAEKTNASLYNNLGITYQNLGRYQEAVEAYREAIYIKPNSEGVLYNLGGCLQVAGSYDEAAIIFRQALNVNPDYAEVYPLLIHSLLYQCNWDDLSRLMAKFIQNTENELATGRRTTAAPFGMLSTPTSADLRKRVSIQHAQRMAKDFSKVKEKLNFQHKPRQRDKIRIGYVSPDFRLHSVGVVFKQIMRAHDKSKFEIHGYSVAPQAPDQVTQYLMQFFDSLTSVYGWPHEKTAQRIYDDGIDVLIDLGGWTRNTRLEIFALEAAPVQAHYLGYGATLGADFIPYLITDPQVIPPEKAEEWCTEKCVYLPDSFMPALTIDVTEPTPTRASQGLPEDGFVFANFNAHSKFYPTMYDIWMRLLKRVPGSVLWLVAGQKESQANLRRATELRGVDPDRVIFAERAPYASHLARESLADLALDNLHHDGGVTTLDCLWQGLPVLTIAGQTANARTGQSILTAFGMPELTTSSLIEYEARAFEIATTPGMAQALRDKVKQQCQKSNLYNITRLTRHLERAYEMMFQDFNDGVERRHLFVEPLPDDLECDLIEKDTDTGFGKALPKDDALPE